MRSGIIKYDEYQIDNGLPDWREIVYVLQNGFLSKLLTKKKIGTKKDKEEKNEFDF